MPLFQPGPRTDSSPIRVRETPYAFYDRVKGDIWDTARTLINGWIAEMDSQQATRVEAELKKYKTETQFQEVFLELYLHHAFLEMGFDVEFEPQILQAGRISSQTPDLRLRKGGNVYYVEATVLNEPGEEAEQRYVRRQLKEQINQRLKHPNFGLSWQVKQQGRLHDLKVTDVVSQLKDWLNTLDVNEVSATWRTHGFPNYVYQNGLWEISFDAWPFEPADGWVQLDEIIGIGLENQGGGLASKDAHAIRDAIKKKGKKYDALNAPLIVCMQLARLGAGVIDVRAALYGGASIDAQLLKTGRIEGQLQGIDIDGVWATKSGAEYSQVSAVITIDHHLEPAGVGEIRPTIWTNPWARHSVGGIFNWPTMVANSATGVVDCVEP